ncbi:hypothetical protein [Dyadobacter chenhuakuii]|nr:hypothetical protein [Dyadobacter chenhuakuii]
MAWNPETYNKFKDELTGFQRLSPVLNIGDYARILFENGGSEITV